MSTALCLAAGLFTLSWTHSVERIEWREQWAVTDAGLVLQEARVKGSGAGMEPGEGAGLENGWWVWKPQTPLLPHLVLAASGATMSGWTLCDAGGCRELGRRSGDPIVIGPCADGKAVAGRQQMGGK